MVDIFIIVVLVWALFSGWRAGLLKEVTSGIGVLVGLLVAATCYFHLWKIFGSEWHRNQYGYKHYCLSFAVDYSSHSLRFCGKHANQIIERHKFGHAQFYVGCLGQPHQIRGGAGATGNLAAIGGKLR